MYTLYEHSLDFFQKPVHARTPVIKKLRKKWIKDTRVETRFSVAKGGPKRSAFGKKSGRRRNQFYRFRSK